MNRIDVPRILRWYVPAWVALTALTIGATATGRGQPVAAVLWVALFVASVGGIALLVVADEQHEARLDRSGAGSIDPASAVRDRPAPGDLLPTPHDVRRAAP